MLHDSNERIFNTLIELAIAAIVQLGDFRFENALTVFDKQKGIFASDFDNFGLDFSLLKLG